MRNTYLRDVYDFRGVVDNKRVILTCDIEEWKRFNRDVSFFCDIIKQCQNDETAREMLFNLYAYLEINK